MSDKAVYKQIIKTILISGLVDRGFSPPNARVIHDSDDDSDDDDDEPAQPPAPAGLEYSAFGELIEQNQM